MREEITPKNIIMKGPTGVGKTEIARRLAKLVKAPFLKVEATKYTEVGYVGRDVESMIRDLAEVAIRLVKEEKYAEVSVKAKDSADKRIAEALLPARKKLYAEKSDDVLREEIVRDLPSGKFNSVEIEIKVSETLKPIELAPGMGATFDLGELMGGMGMSTKKQKPRKVTVEQAYKLLIAEESEKLIDTDNINAEAVRRAEQEGIIFIDEIDKIAGKSTSSSGHDVSREGVQRDILPIIEGSTVMTKYGAIRTDFILFIASGAFHISKIDDLIPELQGRFPIRVDLCSLGKEDFINILTQPVNAITKQYACLLAVDNVKLVFKDDAIEEIANICVLENETSENIGARRLHTVLEQLLEDISFNATGEYSEVEVVIDKKYVNQQLSKTVKKHDLKKYIL
jgi:ATP-dependent HslUV protease ATP-binding subunit HslU